MPKNTDGLPKHYKLHKPSKIMAYQIPIQAKKQPKSTSFIKPTIQTNHNNNINETSNRKDAKGSAFKNLPQIPVTGPQKKKFTTGLKCQLIVESLNIALHTAHKYLHTT